MSIIAIRIYKLSLDLSKLNPNYFQTFFEMELQKSKKGPKEGPHNQALKNAIKHLRSIDRIRNDKTIVDKTGYHKSTVSEYVRGIEPASQDFLTEFENKFGI